MKRIAVPLILLVGFGGRAECRKSATMVQSFEDIKPSAELIWTPCFDNFTCSRLKVPLDYSNPDLGTAPIAFMKLAGKNVTSDSQSIVIIPGGPGGSSIDLLQEYKDQMGLMFGETYNFVGLDPRGIERSGPKIDCFRNKEARKAFNRAHYTGATNTSTNSFEEQYYSAEIYGDLCNKEVKTKSPYGYYVTSPAVARDILTFIEADAKLAGHEPSEAKLWGFGNSYASVIGTTFASMFPDRVERLILESVLDVDQYYKNNWRSNFIDSDKAFEQFSVRCHAAGPDLCAFWGPTPENITARIDTLIRDISSHPIPVSGIGGHTLPGLATYSDLKSLIAYGIYEPRTYFPIFADIFAELESGNASALIGWSEKLYLASDVDVIIRCADSYRNNKLVTLEDWKDYIEDSVSRSKYIGDVFPIWARTILCRSLKPRLPDSMMLQGPVTGINKPMSFPILFTSNTLDPVAPAANAHKMALRFPGSVVLLQESVGHPVTREGGSPCYYGHIQGYLQGVLPPANITCPQKYFPFLD
ncbi:hypothetical protein HYE67_002018 [Fusarium culmorum]|uniref:Peptidase S33 tripeptidyl aminopeptidase-like C-terminal domain-containing protein n=1 Tax=Fusarium culmorum TaxID=5516 RepID=A0A7S8HSG5_FUSCU|nr:hypothetical protein HYE67_002018 [Fusarium culmorum]